MVGHKRLMFFICASLFFLSILAPSLLTVPVQAVIPAVSVSPSSLTVEPEQNFNVDITISDVLDLYGWEFALSWDPYVLDAVNVVEGPFLKGDGRSTFFTYSISLIDGRMVVDCTLLGWISGVSGSGILSTLTFCPKNPGECSLDLYNFSLIDSNEQPIFCQTSNGYVRIISPHDVAVTEIEVSTLIASPGNVVGINVSLQNQGSYAEILDVTAYVNSTIIGTQQISLNEDSATMVSYAWNTTGYAKGDYLIHVAVTPVPGEADLSDNTKTADSLVTILTIGHDVAVVTIEPEKTVICQGYDLIVTVTVGNYGVYNETFNVAAYANTTVLGFQAVTLSSGAKADVLFVKSTSSFSRGNYTLNASASLVSGETEIDDNTLADGWVVVSMVGDLTGGTPNVWDFVPDGKVGGVDVSVVTRCFGSWPEAVPPMRWEPNCDINNNGKVDGTDVAIVSRHFGEAEP